ncbi:hypothetical protein L602_000400000960 [Cupriavidus gilardii J11]|uniref:Uncharacterized protein n=1 Tax=Cupriavidus gilardii J11 TaxID=936133 RepID=A0A562B9B8_9BURK|nr:cobalt-zinc-cadmium resistance protein [Cupriavidus gilardii]TWG81777.1 hypothetical protein L602_000400000960 [Cupriavidus gilardii J11]
MRILLLFLFLSCLSTLPLEAAAASRLDLKSTARSSPLVCSMASVAAVATVAVKAVMAEELDDSRIVAPGDDGLHPDDVVAQAPERPGYCNIWSADLLDPPDVLDEIEESSALFAVPMVRLELPSGDVAQAHLGSMPPVLAALYKPPITHLSSLPSR